ncbi:MAG: acyltransferase [Ruminococcaceae bacterium]|nr:acyltransferase [Oscillospiraceae bacterium]
MKLTDTVTLAYILLLVSAVRPAKGADCLSKDSTVSMRGLFALTVVLHHLSAYAYSGLTFPIFSYVGFISVSVFFFLSGYGLMTRYGQQGRGYLKSVLTNRIPRLVAIYLITTVVYALVFMVMGYKVTLRYVLWSFVSGSPLALNSWYILALLLLYLMFCAVFALFGKRKGLSLTMMATMTLCYILVLHKLGYDYHWYMSVPGFAVGIIWAASRESIHAMAEKKWWLWTIAAAVVFWLVYRLSGLTMIWSIPGLNLGSRLAAAATFPVLVVLLSMKLKLGGKLLNFMGGISLELYLFHGLVYAFLRSSVVYISNDALWVWLSVVLSVAVAFIFNRVFKIFPKPHK